MTRNELKQYNAIKEQYPLVVLLFRVGDFYELYLDDAKVASKVLNITLTKQADNTPMAGFPFHALKSYIPKLVRSGYRMAICDALDK